MGSEHGRHPQMTLPDPDSSSRGGCNCYPRGGVSSALFMSFRHCSWALMTLKSSRIVSRYKRSLVFGAGLLQTYSRSVGPLD